MRIKTPIFLHGNLCIDFLAAQNQMKNKIAANAGNMLGCNAMEVNRVHGNSRYYLVNYSHAEG